MEKITISIPVPKIIISFSLWLFLKYKKICFGSDLKVIPMNNGKYAFVDSADFEKISKNKWGTKTSNCTSYALRVEKGKYFYMHNEIMQPPAGFLVDHMDRNGLNNSRGNLRLATRSQNICNQKKRSGCTSKFKGVHYSKSSRKWAVCIKFDGKRLFLGYFKNEEDAAKAYDNAAKELHGEFAFLNFPQ